MVITRTPFRISFFGGGTDLPSWYKENGGAVLSTTIDKYCYISGRRLPSFFDHKHRVVYSKQELREELSLTISHDELIPLITDPVKEHPRLADVRAYFFYFTRKVPFSFLEEMDGIKTGCREDHEYISIKVVKMSEVVNCRTPSALIGVKLLERALNRIF